MHFYKNFSVKDTIDKIIVGKLNFDATEFQNITNEGVEMIKGLLNINPNERFNPYEVINHPWMKISDLNIVRKKFYNKSEIFEDSIEYEFKKMTFISRHDTPVNRTVFNNIENIDCNNDNDFFSNENNAENFDYKKGDIDIENFSSYKLLNIQHRKRSGSI